MGHESVFAHKALTGKLPKNIVKRFKGFQPKLVTIRNKLNKLNIPQHNLSKFKKSPIYRTINSWNRTPTNLPFGKIKSHTNTQKYHIHTQTHKKTHPHTNTQKFHIHTHTHP